MKQKPLKINIEEEQDVEWGEVKVTRRYWKALKEEARKQMAKEQLKQQPVIDAPNVYVQEDWDIPEGFEVFDEED